MFFSVQPVALAARPCGASHLIASGVLDDQTGQGLFTASGFVSLMSRCTGPACTCSARISSMSSCHSRSQSALTTESAFLSRCEVVRGPPALLLDQHIFPQINWAESARFSLYFSSCALALPVPGDDLQPMPRRRSSFALSRRSLLRLKHL